MSGGGAKRKKKAKPPLVGAAGNLSQYFFKSQESLATVIDNEEGEPQLQSPLCSPGDPTTSTALEEGSGASTPVAEGQSSTGGKETAAEKEQPNEKGEGSKAKS